MRPGPATPAASSVDLLTRLIRHSRGGMMLLARQRSRGSAAFAKAGCTRDLAILRSQSATAAGAGSPFPLMSGIGEEAATPGQPVRVCTRFRNVPRRFTLENHRLLQALPQSSGKLRKLSRFRCTHSPSEPLRPQQKNSPPLCENCGRKAFLVETRGKLRKITDHKILLSADAK
jgi:hypothetical protein